MFVEQKYKGTQEYDLVYEHLKLVVGNRRKTDYGVIFAIMGISPFNTGRKSMTWKVPSLNDTRNVKGATFSNEVTQ